MSKQDVQDLQLKYRPTTSKIHLHLQIQKHLKFQSCLITEYAGICFWMREDNISWNPPWTTCGDVGAVWFYLTFFVKVSDTVTIFCNSPAVVLGESLATQTLFFNYFPDGGNGNFLKANSLICEAQLSFAAHQKYILSFSSLWLMIKGIWPLFSLLFIFLWNSKTWLDNFMFIITLECLKL